ncbi:MAG: rod shape-determining protein MreC [Saprospiraceae bacterium]|nr:rod shape-determining protein MreC [Saprospiraceae bacterium]
MQNILFFLYRYGYVLLFLLLQVFCVNLVVRFNPYQKDIFIKSSGAVSGWLLDKYDGVVQFFNLSNVAEDLAEENARLRTQALTFQEIYGPASSHSDSNRTQQYTMIAAKVINNSIAKLDNYFTLNVGARDGIESGLGVIQTDGIMGVITDVSNRYSRGISLLHRDLKISVSIQRNNFFGTLSWTGGDPKKAKLGDIPKHADLAPGDVIVTSGFSALFPQGITVGKITNFELKQGSNFYDIDVELTNDLSQAHYVYVIKNLHAREQIELESQNN